MRHLVIPSVLILLAAFLSVNQGLTGYAPHQTLFKSQLVGGTDSDLTNVYPSWHFFSGAEEVRAPSIEVYNYLAKRLDFNKDGIFDESDIATYGKIVQTLAEPDFARNIGIRPSMYGKPGNLQYNGAGFKEITKLTRYGLPAEGDISYLDIYPIYYNKKTGELSSGYMQTIDNKDLKFATAVVAKYASGSITFYPKSNDCSPNNEGRITSGVRGQFKNTEELRSTDGKYYYECKNIGSTYQYVAVKIPDDMTLRGKVLMQRTIPHAGEADIYP